MPDITQSIQDAVAIFSHAKVEETKDGRQASLIALHTVGRYSFWAEARLLAEIDTRQDWCDGHTSLWEWYQDFIEANGYDRPEQSEYQSFRMRTRCGFLFARCQRDEISPDLLLGLDHTKADAIYRATQETDANTLRHYLERAAQMRRSDVLRMLAPATNGAHAVTGAAGAKKTGKGDTGRTPGEDRPLDAGSEPPAAAPIPDDDRSPSTETVACPRCRHIFEWKV